MPTQEVTARRFTVAMAPASSPTRAAARCGMGAAGSGSYLGAGTEGWGAGQGAAGPPKLPEPRTPSFAAATAATATTATTQGSGGSCWGLAAAARTGGSLTRGWAKGAMPRGWASESPRAIALAPCPGPACGGRHKGAFQAPPDHWGDCTYTPIPALCRGKQPVRQHPWGLPEGFRGLRPVLGAPGRWVPEQGVARCSPPTPSRVTHPAPPHPSQHLHRR